MNFAIIDGIVGSVERKGAAVFARICHKESWFDEKKQEWVHEDNWLTVAFFGKRGESLERTVKIGTPIAVEAAITTFPKEGPGSQMRLSGKSFHFLQKREAPTAPPQDIPEEIF